MFKMVLWYKNKDNKGNEISLNKFSLANYKTTSRYKELYELDFIFNKKEISSEGLYNKNEKMSQTLESWHFKSYVID